MKIVILIVACLAMGVKHLYRSNYRMNIDFTAKPSVLVSHQIAGRTAHASEVRYCSECDESAETDAQDRLSSYALTSYRRRLQSSNC